MVVRKKKKTTKMLGRRYRGTGHRNATRAGHRGGRGLAGTGKRADQKKPSIWKNKKYFSGRDFKPTHFKKPVTINLRDLPILIENKGLTPDKSGFITLDLTSEGFDKLLGKGNINLKLKVKVASATQKAIDKIKAVGGEVELLNANIDSDEFEENAEIEE
ncbi:MAG: large subunit ribosomal protein [Candidatus Woesearchaeota archaeon]|nr:large subunit ribosomal protein [Candidatus Woesearchaeota archaeon]